MKDELSYPTTTSIHPLPIFLRMGIYLLYVFENNWPIGVWHNRHEYFLTVKMCNTVTSTDAVR